MDFKNILNKFSSININNSNTELINVPGNPTSLFYQVIVRTGNRNYRQYFLFKKHNNMWYNHSIYFDDEDKNWFREEEFWSLPATLSVNESFVMGYPDFIKTMPPLVENLITYDKTNLSSIKKVQDSISSSNNYGDKEISKMTNTPLFIVKRIRNELSSD